MIHAAQPMVGFALPAHDESVVRSSELAGKAYLLYFYPKASTPG